MKGRQTNGFSVVEAVLAVLVAGLLIFIGWWVWQAQQNKNQAASNDEPSYALDPYAGWQQYTDKVGRFSVKYPADWERTTQEGTQGEGGPAITSTIFTSPTGKTLKVDANYGGRGGMCDPAPTDEPFKPGNACASTEVMFAERLDPGRQLYQDSRPVNLFMVGKKYAAANAEPNYLLGLVTSENDSIATHQAEMGAFFPLSHFAISNQDGSRWINIETTASGEGEDFFTSPDGETIKQILRSFTINDWPDRVF